MVVSVSGCQISVDEELDRRKMSAIQKGEVRLCMHITNFFRLQLLEQLRGIDLRKWLQVYLAQRRQPYHKYLHARRACLYITSIAIQ